MYTEMYHIYIRKCVTVKNEATGWAQEADDWHFVPGIKVWIVIKIDYENTKEAHEHFKGI